MTPPRLTQSSRSRSVRRQPPAIKLLSLIWTDGALPGREPPSVVWEHDLGLGELIQAMTGDRRYASYVRRVLVSLIADPEVIARRQAVFGDFMRNPALVERIGALLP